MIPLNSTMRHVLFVLNISQTFDEVWRERLLLKFRSNGIGCLLLNIPSLISHLVLPKNCFSGKSSEWKMTMAGNGQLLFVVYKNDLPKNMSEVRLFVDVRRYLPVLCRY